jgi:hypothetical protein
MHRLFIPFVPMEKFINLLNQGTLNLLFFCEPKE